MRQVDPGLVLGLAVAVRGSRIGPPGLFRALGQRAELTERDFPVGEDDHAVFALELSIIGDRVRGSEEVRPTRRPAVGGGVGGPTGELHPLLPEDGEQLLVGNGSAGAGARLGFRRRLGAGGRIRCRRAAGGRPDPSTAARCRCGRSGGVHGRRGCASAGCPVGFARRLLRLVRQKGSVGPLGHHARSIAPDLVVFLVEPNGLTTDRPVAVGDPSPR